MQSIFFPWKHRMISWPEESKIFQGAWRRKWATHTRSFLLAWWSTDSSAEPRTLCWTSSTSWRFTQYKLVLSRKSHIIHVRRWAPQMTEHVQNLWGFSRSRNISNILADVCILWLCSLSAAHSVFTLIQRWPRTTRSTQTWWRKSQRCWDVLQATAWVQRSRRRKREGRRRNRRRNRLRRLQRGDAGTRWHWRRWPLSTRSGWEGFKCPSGSVIMIESKMQRKNMFF